ncbi:MAG TPA: hypothetical protein VMU11_01960 [Verrucomicrobiae bacterium]|nr:hypothetical protein [Verrucomicrobiae bacterium]
MKPYQHPKKLSPEEARRVMPEAPVAPEAAPVTKTRTVPPPLRESMIDEIIGAVPKPPRAPRAIRSRTPKPKPEELLVSDRVAHQFVVHYLKHRYGLQDYLDERTTAVISGRRRQRLKEKPSEQVRHLEHECLLTRMRTIVAGGIDTGRRTRKKSHRIIRIQRGYRGPIYYATVCDADNRLIGFYTSEWFRRPDHRKRQAHRRRHSRS